MEARAPLGYVVVERHEKREPRVWQPWTGAPTPVVTREEAESWCHECTEAEAENPQGHTYTVEPVGGAVQRPALMLTDDERAALSMAIWGYQEAAYQRGIAVLADGTASEKHRATVEAHNAARTAVDRLLWPSYFAALARAPDSTACARCGHPQDWHRHDDADHHDPSDPACPFRCIGYDCEADGPPHDGSCDCPDYAAARPLPHDERGDHV